MFRCSRACRPTASMVSPTRGPSVPVTRNPAGVSEHGAPHAAARHLGWPTPVACQGPAYLDHDVRITRLWDDSLLARRTRSAAPRDQSSFADLSLDASHTNQASLIQSTTPGAHHAAPSGTRFRCGIGFAIIMAPITHLRCAYAIPRTTALRLLPVALPSARREHLTSLLRGLDRNRYR